MTSLPRIMLPNLNSDLCQHKKTMGDQSCTTDYHDDDHDPLEETTVMQPSSVLPDHLFNIKNKVIKEEMERENELESFPGFGKEAAAALKLEPLLTGELEVSVDISEMTLQSEEGPPISAPVPVPSSHSNSERPSCFYCEFVSTADNRSAASTSLELHLVRYHPEHFFPEESSQATGAGLTQAQFKLIAIDTLFPEFMTWSGKQALCSLCTQMYSSNNLYNNRNKIQKHLVCEHRMELRKRLGVILEGRLRKRKRNPSDTTGNKIKAEKLENKIENTLEIPSITIETEVFYDENGDAQHDYDPLGETSRSDYTFKEVSSHSKDDFMSNFVTCLLPSASKCRYCANPCTPKKLKEHKMEFHPELYFPEEEDKTLESGITFEEFKRILKDNLFPQFSLLSEEFMSCSLCNVNYCRRNSDLESLRVAMQMHLIDAHKVELKERLNSILEDPLLEQM